MAAAIEDPGATSHLFRPGAAANSRTYLARIWGLRHFIAASAKGRLSARNQGMILGSVWLLLEPFMFVLVYYFIFEVVLDASRGLESFFLFLTVGRLVFGNHQAAVLGAAQSLSDNPAVVRDSSMPKAVLPLGVSVGTFYQWIIEAFVMILVAVVTGVLPRPSWLLIVPLSLGILALNIGIGLLLSPLIALYGDLKRALPVLYRLLFYSTGVIFPLESYVDQLEHSDLIWAALMANPIYGYVKAMQWAVFGYDVGHPVLATIVSICWTVTLLPLAFIMFARRERNVGAFRYKVGG